VDKPHVARRWRQSRASRRNNDQVPWCGTGTVDATSTIAAASNRLPRELGPMTDAAPDFPLPLGATAPLRAKAEQQGDGEFTPLWSGQAGPLAREMPAQALTLALANEARARFKQMTG
jgi:hypothetical protein